MGEVAGKRPGTSARLAILRTEASRGLESLPVATRSAAEVQHYFLFSIVPTSSKLLRSLDCTGSLAIGVLQSSVPLAQELIQRSQGAVVTVKSHKQYVALALYNFLQDWRISWPVSASVSTTRLLTSTLIAPCIANSMRRCLPWQGVSAICSMFCICVMPVDVDHLHDLLYTCKRIYMCMRKSRTVLFWTGVTRRKLIRK